jgi:large conductance mechanosensitive channel
MGFVQEFKQFAMRGNVIDLAVGIVIGAAFGRIVSSFVDDVLMPPIGLLIGGVNFSELALSLEEASGETAAVTINYGIFIQTLIDFLIIACAVFLVVKGINAMQRKEKAAPEAAPVPPTGEEVLLAEIRDILKSEVVRGRLNSGADLQQ